MSMPIRPMVPSGRPPASRSHFEPPSLEPGSAANLVLFDPAARWEAGTDGWESRSGNSCFAGRELTGVDQISDRGAAASVRAEHVADEVLHSVVGGNRIITSDDGPELEVDPTADAELIDGDALGSVDDNLRPGDSAEVVGEISACRCGGPAEERK